jgi:hypothetical protein
VNATVYIAKYVPDLQRNEPRNVGVVVVLDDLDAVSGVPKLAARFLERPERQRGGTDEQRESLLAFREIVGEQPAYDGWVAFWRESLEDGVEGLRSAFERQRPSFPLVEAGRIAFFEIKRDPRSIADELYRRLVLPPRAEIAESTGAVDRFEKVVREAGLMARNDFVRNFEIDGVNLNRPIVFHYPYALVNGHTTVMAKLSRAGEATIGSTLWQFEHLPVDVRKVALVNEARMRHPELAENLEAVATVLDVSSKDAVERLHALGD